MREFLVKVEKFYDKLADFVGFICMFVMVLLIADVFFNVTGRYFFKYGNVAMQELEWHFFAVIILLGLSYVLKEDAHVRVDAFYEKFSPKAKAIINMVCTILFIIPISFLIAYLSFDYVLEAYNSGERSADPGGLTDRWIIKAFIPFSFWLLIFFSIGYFVKHLNLYFKAKEQK